MTTWKSFLIRAASAVVALALIIGLYLGWAADGLKMAIMISVLVGSWELKRILFFRDPSISLKNIFFALVLITFGASLLSLSVGSLAFSLALITLIIIVFLKTHHHGDLSSMMTFQAKGALGLFYMGLLPSFPYRILEQAQGVSWFVFLLAVVFSGDTFAYIFGVLIGKHKVMPSVSPKKTWQGSFGGIVGSLLAGYLCWHFLFSTKSLFPFLVLSALAGFAGQFGDFFESLLKRVADVKDSGKIMPGHGGVLDRIDGVLFASPVILAGILILSHL